ncbi:MAG: gamma-glutamyltransferase [Acidobacteria bacterium]|nr:gamma-glutamyltransferase [Acidobacteriota bacterium]
MHPHWPVLVLLLAAQAVPLTAAQPVRARRAMVVTREDHATRAGVAVLRSGGNAIDAAVAVAFALAVTHPSAGNLGGGGFLLARFPDGRTTFLDFREKAPAKASHDMYLDAAGRPTRDSLAGWRASGVPGTVRGLELAHKRYGRTPWPALLKPAIALATTGFPVPYSLAAALRTNKNLALFPESRRVFQRDGRFREAGETLVHPELARTLERIARHGAADFYEGETARRLDQEMRANGGLITLDDLRNYRAVERQPLQGTYRDYTIVTAPPPSSGGVVLLETLGILEGSGYEKTGAGSAASIHHAAEAMRRAYADRSQFLGDPDFVQVPVARLLGKPHIAGWRASIDLEHATPSDRILPGGADLPPSEHTTHFSIADAEGTLVAVTYTLNDSYGSGVTVPGLGFLLNNEMDDFAAKPGTPNLFGLIQGEANSIQPGKRPLSCMTPTIVLREGKPVLVLGSPGGARIINSVLEVILNVVDFGMNIQDAVNYPRFHHQWKPDRIEVEWNLSPDTLRLLEARGHAIRKMKTFCEIGAIAIRDGWLEGAPDPRVEATAEGY